MIDKIKNRWREADIGRKGYLITSFLISGWLFFAGYRLIPYISNLQKKASGMGLLENSEVTILNSVMVLGLFILTVHNHLQRVLPNTIEYALNKKFRSPEEVS